MRKMSKKKKEIPWFLLTQRTSGLSYRFESWNDILDYLSKNIGWGVEIIPISGDSHHIDGIYRDGRLIRIMEE